MSNTRVWNAKKFVDYFGLEYAKQWFDKNIAHTTTHHKYVDMLNDMPVGVISTKHYGGFHTEYLLQEILKRDSVWKQLTSSTDRRE